MTSIEPLASDEAGRDKVTTGLVLLAWALALTPYATLALYFYALHPYVSQRFVPVLLSPAALHWGFSVFAAASAAAVTYRSSGGGVRTAAWTAVAVSVWLSMELSTFEGP